MRDGVAADAVLVKRATFASKMNTYLSAPMLFGMVGAQHYGSMDWKIALIVIVFSEAVIWHMYKVSAKGGASI